MNIGKEELDFVYELAYGYALGMGLDEAGAKKHAQAAVRRAWESK